MNLSNFGMDTITLGGSLESKLAASRAAGFTQLMLWARDLTTY
ncbi:MAG TPA: sugar phosphate isomerase/epimerase, partial [Pseudoduganella sp.]